MPGTTQRLVEEYKNDKICFSLEFLRVRCAVDDFIHNHELLAIGAHNKECFDLVCELHGGLPKNILHLSPTEAELLKYYNNVCNSVRISFANYMYEIAQKLGADYDKVFKGYLKTGKSTGMYLAVNENLRGFGGMCLPKDTKAIGKLSENAGITLELISTVISDNEKVAITVFEGMRR